MSAETIIEARQALTAKNPQEAIDKLENYLASNLASTEVMGEVLLLRVEALFQLEDYNKIIELTQQGLECFQKNARSSKEISRLLEIIGRSYFFTGRYNEAIFFLKEASVSWMNDPASIRENCRCEIGIAYAWLHIGEKALAEKKLNQLLQIVGHLDEPNVKRSVLMLAAAVYSHLAIEYYQGETKYYNFFVSFTKLYPCVEPAFQRRIVDALEFLEQAYTLEPVEPSSLASAIALSNASLLCTLIGKADHALYLLETALPIFREFGTPTQLCNVLQNQAYAYLHSPKPEATVPILEEAWRLAKKYKIDQIVPSLLFDLMQAYLKQHNTLVAIDLAEKVLSTTVELANNRLLAVQRNGLPPKNILKAIGQEATNENASTTPKGMPSYIQIAKTYLAENLTRRPTIAEVANQANVTPRTIQLGFVKHMGIPPMKWAQNMRLQGIHDELTSLPSSVVVRIGDISKKWGYAQVSTFCQEYKKKFGFPPSLNRRIKNSINFNKKTRARVKGHRMAGK